MLGPFIKEFGSQVKTEAGNTEDGKARIQNVNKEVVKNGVKAGPFQQTGRLTSVCLDFDAYFPSLDLKKCFNIAEERLEKSNVNVICDTNELSLFIACSQTDKKI